MKHLVEPSGFRAELKKDKMNWEYVRTDPRATVFKARWGVDIDMYFIVINTDKTFKANSKLVKAEFEPYTRVMKQEQPDAAGRQQRYTISWRNVVETTAEQRQRNPRRLYDAPTADIWVHGQWMGIRRYSFPNQMAKCVPCGTAQAGTWRSRVTMLAHVCTCPRVYAPQVWLRPSAAARDPRHGQQGGRDVRRAVRREGADVQGTILRRPAQHRVPGRLGVVQHVGGMGAQPPAATEISVALAS